MANFMGSYEHTLDTKGRLILPSTFRSDLENGAVAVLFDECLAIMPLGEFSRMTNYFRDQEAQGKTTRAHLRALSSHAERVTPDSQGRIRLPNNLRTLAALDREVVIAGVFERVEVWNPLRWKSNFPSGTVQLVASLARQYGLGVPESAQNE